MSQIEQAKKVKYTIDGDMVKIFTFSLQDFLYIVRRDRPVRLCQNPKHQLPRLSYPVASAPQDL